MAYCPKCRTNNLLKGHCLSCGWEGKTNQEKHKLFQENAQEIATDFLKLGYKEVKKKWGISSSTLYEIPEVREYMIRPPVNGHPVLPEFSNDWSAEVQLKWLEVWEKLKCYSQSCKEVTTAEHNRIQ